MKGKLPDFRLEMALWDKGLANIAGVDEVGRGAFAGPVACGCVVFDPKRVVRVGEPKLEVLINDSKKLSKSQREVASEWIKNNCKSWGVGFANVSEINRYGIIGATNKAFRRAIQTVSQNLGGALNHLISDAFYIPNVAGLSKYSQTPVVKGDTKSITVASAAIIAKVERDMYMQELGKTPEFSVYFWGLNKGYGTNTHREAIAKHGISSHHRTKFVESWISKTQKRRA